MHRGFPFASHCVLCGCAVLICNRLSVCTWSLSSTMAVQGSEWSSGMYSMLLLRWQGFNSLTNFFFAFFVTCLAEKIRFPCTNKACQKKMNAHRLPICISLCAVWVCSSDLQPNLSCSSQSDGKIVVACTNTPCHKKIKKQKSLIIRGQ